MAKLLSVNVGLPRAVEWKGKTVRTAVWKDGPRPPLGREVEHRRRWPERFTGSRWRAPGLFSSTKSIPIAIGKGS
jgi:Na+-transporting NADH:ubiquinone oxidoreductase subunit NqrC